MLLSALPRSWPHRTSRVSVLTLALSFAGALSVSALDPPKTLADYSVTNWSDTDGPFPYGIYAIAQDPEGFLWLGARIGLVRFDGVNFVLWSERVPLPRERLSAICASKDGTIWVSFEENKGVSRIDKDRVTNYGQSDGLGVEYILTLIEDMAGSIWAGGYGGLARFRNGQWQSIGRAEGLPVATIQRISEDESGGLWVGSTAGVYRRAATEDVFRFVAPNLVRGFALDKSGVMWVTDQAKIFTRLPDSASSAVRSSDQDLGDGIGRALIADRHGNLWIGTRDEGLIFSRATSDNSRRVVERFRSRDGLVNDSVRALFEDRDGSIWVGTRGGLSRLFKNSVTQVRGFIDGGEAFVHAISPSRDTSLWLATGNGLVRTHQGRTSRYGVSEGLPGRVSTALYEDPTGTLWVATTRGIARSTGSGFLPLRWSQDLGIEKITSLTTDGHGRIWLVDDRQGLVRWRAGNVEFPNRGLRLNPAHVVYTDGRGRVWVGFLREGIEVHDGEAVVSYAAAQGLPPGGINVIYQDTSGAMWIGTTEGVARFDGAHFRTFGTNGLPQSGVMSILEDDQSNLWFGSVEFGLLRVSRDEFTRAANDNTYQLHYRVFGKEDGLPGTLARPGMPSSARASDGSLFFLTSVALARVRPDTLIAGPKAGPVRIEEITADGHSFRPVPGLRLAARTARIEINYSILSLTAPSNVRLRHKLEGFDSNWEDAGPRRQARYMNLAPGSYRFRVAGGNSEEGQIESGATLDFSIQPAFYQTLGFDVAGAVLIAAVIALAWHLRLRFMHRRFDLVLAERTRVARDIHDTLLQSLAAIALDFDDIASQLGSPASALHAQVTGARERVEHYVRETRQSIWNLRSPALQARGLGEALREVGEATTSGAPVTFECMVKGSRSRMHANVEEQFLRIGQEAVTNAVRHSNANAIRVEVVYDAAALTLRVCDDGSGFDVEHVDRAQNGHWGLQHMRERARHVGAQFNIVSGEGSGTIVEAVAQLSADNR